jgi:hypothetical protein
MASYKAWRCWLFTYKTHNIRRVEPLFHGVTFECLCGDAFTSDTLVNLFSLVKWEKLKKSMRQLQSGTDRCDVPGTK